MKLPIFVCLYHLQTLVTLNKASWSDPVSNQYHIQTDEGPERYFKYQTDNGQYRKEKRLQDGTVIGKKVCLVRCRVYLIFLT